MPSLNLGRPEKSSGKCQQSSRKRRAKDVTATDSSKKERKDSDGAEKNKEASEEPASGTRDKFDNRSNDNDIVHTNCKSPNPSSYLFDKIFRSDQSISVPVSFIDKLKVDQNCIV